MTTKEYTQETVSRKLGASNICEILGLTAYQGLVGVYHEKMGEPLEELSLEQLEQIEIAELLRPQILSMVEKKIGLKVIPNSAMKQHPTIEYMVGSVHGFIIEEGKNGLVLAYTCSDFTHKNRDLWNQRQLIVKMKMQHNLACYGFDYGYVGVLVGNRTLELIKVERDETLINLIENGAKEFWGYIERKEIPPLDGKKASQEYLKLAYPKAEPKKETKLNIDVYGELIAEYSCIKEELKPLEEKKKLIENRLKDALGDAEIGIIGSKSVKWSNVTSNRFDSKTFKVDHPDLYQQYVKQSHSRRFSI